MISGGNRWRLYVFIHRFYQRRPFNLSVPPQDLTAHHHRQVRQVRRVCRVVLEFLARGYSPFAGHLPQHICPEIFLGFDKDPRWVTPAPCTGYPHLLQRGTLCRTDTSVIHWPCPEHTPHQQTETSTWGLWLVELLLELRKEIGWYHCGYRPMVADDIWRESVAFIGIHPRIVSQGDLTWHI